MTLVLIGLVGGIITGLSPCVLPVLAGTWTIGQESITAGQGAGITLAFHATEQPAGDGTVTIRLSPGLAAYSFTFG